MQILTIIFLIFSLAGCVSMEISPTENKPSEALRAISAVSEIKHGMSRDEVRRIMGDKLTVGYKASDSISGAFEPIQIDSVYKSDMFTMENVQYSVDYYFTKVFKPDGLVSEEELTPVVYKGNIVVGKGWSEKYALEKK